LCAALEERGWTAFGLDRTQEMVRLARERLPHARERLVRGIAEELPFAAESFDAVVATGALEYVDDLPRALAEAARVLRPQGRLVASYPNYRSPSSLVRGTCRARLPRPRACSGPRADSSPATRTTGARPRSSAASSSIPRRGPSSESSRSAGARRSRPFGRGAEPSSSSFSLRRRSRWRRSTGG